LAALLLTALLTALPGSVLAALLLLIWTLLSALLTTLLLLARLVGLLLLLFVRILVLVRVLIHCFVLDCHGDPPPLRNNAPETPFVPLPTESNNSNGTWPRLHALAARTAATWEATMGRYLLLWLLGIPLPILVLIWVFGGLH